MSVRSKEEGDELVLTLDNGDLREFKNAMSKWGFKDHQSLMRFAVSLLVLNENEYFSVKINNVSRDVAPTDDLIERK